MDERAKTLDLVNEILRRRIREACIRKHVGPVTLARDTGLSLEEVAECLLDPTRTNARVLFQISCYLNIEESVSEILKPLL